MRETFRVINNLEKDGIISGYALGGATALLFYAEPALTFDVDIFILIPNIRSSNGLVNMEPLYNGLKAKGYRAKKEHVMIGGIPVQFLPAYNPLIEDAIAHAETKKYEGIPIKVVTIEYLLAIMIDTNRPKDRERIRKILGEGCFNRTKLDLILNKHSLKKKWVRYIEEK